MQSRETNEEFAREQENANKGWETCYGAALKARLKWIDQMLMEGTDAVSYTHLDVYKRQVLERYRKLCEEQDRESAHCYRNGNLQIPDGAVIMDAGAAEGLSLIHI